MKILIIEDDVNYRDNLCKLLEKWQFKLVVAEDFSNIIEIFIKEQPNLILLDINLPQYDGFYWCSKIRELSKVPIIFISSRNTTIDMVMSMNMGGDDFIQKDFDQQVLIAKINAILRRTYSYIDTNDTIIEHKGLVLNLKDGQVYYDDKKINLTGNEFRILSILMENKGNIVTREKIMRKLWESENFVDDNTLTVNVTRLRKKLEYVGKTDFIITKKGQGYIIQ